MLMLPTSAGAVPLPWTSFVGVLAPFLRTNCVMRRLGSAYCRAGGAMPVRSAAAGARPPSLLVYASSLVGLIFGISGTITRVVRGMGHDIAACSTCHTEAAPRQGTKYFRALVAASSHTHVAPTAPNNHRVGRLQPMYRATDGIDEDVVVVASPPSTWRKASSFSPPVWPEMDALGKNLGLVMGFAASLQGPNPNGGGCVIAAIAFASLPSSHSAALLRIRTLPAQRASVVTVDTHRWLAVVNRGSALLTLAWPSSLHVFSVLLHHMMIIHIFNRSQVGLFVLSSGSLGALSIHTRRESRMLWPLLGDNRRSWRSEDSSPTIGWVTVRVEQPSTRLRAILQHVHAPLRMVGSKHGRGPFLKLECVATHGTSAQTRVGARQDFIRSVLRDSRDDLKVLDLRSTQSTTNTGACPTNMELQRHRVLLSANATELTKIFQVFVKNLQGKSIAINNVTGLTSVEDLKFNVQEKTQMRGVWPELKYQSELLHDGKTLSACGIDQGATLEMTWLLLGGGPTPAPARDTGAAESSHTTGSNIFQLDENIAAELGQRSHSIWRSIGAADDNANKERDAVREPRAAFINECAAQQQDATDLRTMAKRIMDVCNVESLEDYNEHAADALPHNTEASNAAREAPGLESAAVNGANAFEASLVSEISGVLTIFLCVLCAPTVAFAHARTQKSSRTPTLLS
jgi:hypothetical protein